MSAYPGYVRVTVADLRMPDLAVAPVTASVHLTCAVTGYGPQATIRHELAPWGVLA